MRSVDVAILMREDYLSQTQIGDILATQLGWDIRTKCDQEWPDTWNQDLLLALYAEIGPTAKITLETIKDAWPKASDALETLNQELDLSRKSRRESSV